MDFVESKPQQRLSSEPSVGPEAALWKGEMPPQIKGTSSNPLTRGQILRNLQEQRETEPARAAFESRVYLDIYTGVYNRIFFDEFLQDQFLSDSAKG